MQGSTDLSDRDSLRWARALYERAHELAVRIPESVSGIEAQRSVALEDLGLHSPDREGYVASGNRTLSRILPQGEVTENDVFVDFGAGKGRVLLQAARYPFRRVIGVEISAELAATAHRNLQHLDRNLRDKVEIVVADVLDYEVPDEVTVAYFYNPFYGPVFERVVDKLRNSVARSPRSLRIVYRTPIEEKYLFDAGAKLVKEARGPRFWSSTSSTRLYVMHPRRRTN